MGKRKIIGRAVLLLVVAIQFIRPESNDSEQVAGAAFVQQYAVPDSLHSILQSACYDCHSNHSRYPWYSNIQPLAWVLAGHIKRGKSELNFSEFAGYSMRKQVSKLKGVADQVEDNEMPLPSYRWMHKPARLSTHEKQTIINWMRSKADSILNLNP